MGVRNYPDTPRVFLDMDGPLADFEKAVELENSSIEHHKRIAGAYARMPLTPGAKQALATIIELKFEPFSLTKIPRSNPYAATEKLLWVQQNLPELNDRVIISSDKGAVGRPCDILIDDHPEWANANNFPGTTLKFVPAEGWGPIIKKLEFCAKTLIQNASAIADLNDANDPYAASVYIKFLFAKTLGIV